MLEATNEGKLQHEDIIRVLLRERFQRELLRLEKRGRGANSFVYVADLLESPLSTQSSPVYAAGTFEGHVSVLPANVTKVVIKFPNVAALVNEETRVQNEAAAIEIFRSALAEADLAHIVPTVYAWQATGLGNERGSVNGWIALEYMSGTSLEDHPVLSPPPSIVGYGGLKFDSSGSVVTGPTTLPCGGPFRSLPEMHKQMLHKQLEIADDPKADIVDGWRSYGNMLRERLEHFEANGLTRIVEENSVNKPTLVHGDFDIHNVLVGSDGRLTALLDYEFAFVGTVLDEYTLSFPRLFGILGGPWDDGELDKLRNYQLSGFPTELSIPDIRSQVDWELAGMFDAALKLAGAQKPQDFACADTYSALIWFYQDVCPPYLMMPRWLARRTSAEITDHRDRIAKSVDLYLKMWKY
ncbi:hypothetical protein MBLNU13_g00375t1 [Cladosporium sp. NU13]